MPKGRPRFPSRRCRVVASPFYGWSFGVSRDELIIARTWHRDVAQEIVSALNVAEKARRIEEYEMQIATGNQATTEPLGSVPSEAQKTPRVNPEGRS